MVKKMKESEKGKTKLCLKKRKKKYPSRENEKRA